VQKFREAALMAKAELARKAGVSESTIDRVEAGHDCRMETKRKILFALGLSLRESTKLFPRNGTRPRTEKR
jgi:DNA-binding XRE family transcriptional regulator